MSRTGKRRALAIAVLVLGVALFYAVMRVRDVEKDALRLATTGRAALSLLGELAAGIVEGDLDRIRASYVAGYSNHEGSWAQTSLP